MEDENLQKTIYRVMEAPCEKLALAYLSKGVWRWALTGK